MHQLEKANVEDPKSKSSQIPMEIYHESGNVVYGKVEVMNTWRCDFQGLLTPEEENDHVQAAFRANIAETNWSREMYPDNILN